MESQFNILIITDNLEDYCEKIKYCLGIKNGIKNNDIAVYYNNHLDIRVVKPQNLIISKLKRAHCIYIDTKNINKTIMKELLEPMSLNGHFVYSEKYLLFDKN